MAESSSVEWQNLGPYEKAEYLVSSGHLADCSFIVGTDDDVETFTAHKWTLTCASPVFGRMFNGQFKESKSSSEIRLTDCKPADFKVFLLYLYCNEINKLQVCPVESLQSLIYLGEKYMVSALTSGCINLMKSKLSTLPNNDLLKAFEFAHFIDNKDLIGESSKIIKGKVHYKNKPKSNIQNNSSCKCGTGQYCGSYSHNCVCGSGQYCKIHNKQEQVQKDCITDSANFFELNCCTFYKLLEVLSGVASEVVRFNMIEEYVKVNTVVKKNASIPKKKAKKCVLSGGSVAVGKHATASVKESEKTTNFNKVMLDEIIQLINFQKMSLKEFHNGPAKSTLFDTNKKFDLLTEICKVNNLFQ